jgi:adenylosuccinate lyase
MSENLVHDHERDGRAWKGEWAILPGSCLATDKVLALLHGVLEHLEVNVDRMRDNLLAANGFVQAEHVMLALAPKLGKQSAHALVYRVAMKATERDMPLRAAVLAEPQIVALLGVAGIESCFDVAGGAGCCAQMVDRVLAQTHP